MRYISFYTINGLKQEPKDLDFHITQVHVGHQTMVNMYC